MAQTKKRKNSNLGISKCPTDTPGLDGATHDGLPTESMG